MAATYRSVLANLANMKNLSVLITVLNEAQSVEALIQALALQTLPPTEVIIVDGGSTDGTYQKLRKLAKNKYQFQLKVSRQSGNRSVGRNAAARLAGGGWLAITDAGCIPDKNWLAELVKPARGKISIVAGYFYPLAKNDFELAASCYALTMPRLIRHGFLLPTTRSMLIKRQVFDQLGGFDEQLRDNEDYQLARRMLRANMRINMAFAPKATVGWLPTPNWSEFVTTIYRFARGDAYALLWRPKIGLIFGRYLLALSLLVYAFVVSQPLIILVLFLALFFYLLWAIAKNRQYATSGWYYLPLMQVISDFAVIIGTLTGLSRRIRTYFQRSN